MGMYDTVRVEDVTILPPPTTKQDWAHFKESCSTGFHTKDLECLLQEYLIRDNRLYWRDFDSDGPYTRSEYTGTLYFYFPVYIATFVDGVLQGEIIYRPYS